MIDIGRQTVLLLGSECLDDQQTETNVAPDRRYWKVQYSMGSPIVGGSALKGMTVALLSRCKRAKERGGSWLEDEDVASLCWWRWNPWWQMAMVKERPFWLIFCQGSRQRDKVGTLEPTFPPVSNFNQHHAIYPLHFLISREASYWLLPLLDASTHLHQQLTAAPYACLSSISCCCGGVEKFAIWTLQPSTNANRRFLLQ